MTPLPAAGARSTAGPASTGGTPVVSSARASGTTGLLGPGWSRWGGHTGSTGQPLLTDIPHTDSLWTARERPAAGGGEALPARPQNPAGTDTRAARKGCRPGAGGCEGRLAAAPPAHRAGVTLPACLGGWPSPREPLGSPPRSVC